MTITALIHSVGNIGIFPSRAFIPAFLTALLLRFGPHIPMVQASGILYGVSGTPTWFTSDITLVILGILSVLEIAATKSSDVREFLHEFDPFIKSAMSFLTTAGVLSAADIKLTNEIQGHAPGLTDLGLSAAVAGAVFYVTSLRSGVMSVLSHADPHDDLHLQRLVSWFEDLWSAFGLLLIVLFPILMLAVVLLITGMLYAMQRYLEYREDKSKIPCASCGTPLYSMALACPSCKAQTAQPFAVGFLGMPSSNLAANRQSHALDLIAKKRCPNCATRFIERASRQACSACGHILMETSAESTAYLSHIDQRLPQTLGVCLALSAIPVVGIIPGIIYYRIKMVAPFRQYIGFGTGVLVKWGVRLLNLVLILLQPVPILGAFLVPLMAFTNYRVYRSVYAGTLNAPPKIPPQNPAAIPEHAASA
jgi:Zn finger protein HypA/HybF involved in hydrogenase expression